MDAPVKIFPVFVNSTYRITKLHYTYGYATLSAAYVDYLHLENHWVTLQLWVRHLKCSFFWLPLVSESLADTTLMGV